MAAPCKTDKWMRPVRPQDASNPARELYEKSYNSATAGMPTNLPTLDLTFLPRSAALTTTNRLTGRTSRLVWNQMAP